MAECQRRGLFKLFFKNLNKDFRKYRTKRSIVDSTELESFNFSCEVNYSGKSHKYAAKITVEINDEYIPLSLQFAKGSTAESKEIDKFLLNKDKLPYELYLDMGYEKYERRRELKKKGCQVHMEQKIRKNSKKKIPCFPTPMSINVLDLKLRGSSHGYSLFGESDLEEKEPMLYFMP